MIKEAIQYLAALTQAGEAPPTTFVPLERVRDDVSLHSMEQYGERPLFQRLKFNTTRLTDFNAYLANEANADESVVFIDPDAGGAHAVIDFGTHDTPEWKHHQANLAMTKTPEYLALESACEPVLSQRDMVTFLEDFHYCITPAIRKTGNDSVTDGTVAQAIQVVRKLEVKQARETSHEEGDFSSRAEGMESIDMRGRDGNEIVSLAFACQPYDDTEKRTIEVRLMKHTEGSKPGLKLRIVAPDQIRRAVQTEIETRISDHLPGLRIFIGHIGKRF